MTASGVPQGDGPRPGGAPGTAKPAVDRHHAAPPAGQVAPGQTAGGETSPGPAAPDPGGHPDDAIPFRRHVGIRVVEAGGGRAVLVLPARPEVGNRFGNVHGGALATLVDGAMSNAILSRLPAHDRIGGTVELSIRFLEPATGDVRAEGRVLRVGGRIAFAQADVWDERGRMVATAQGSYVLHRQRPPEEPAPPDSSGRGSQPG
ncbi:thioesterase superfamily protein [Thermaerobacter marianensis DSM 12885]|uniref:Thioesterase superfamily protein n=1 Tax=Thermaerobacter marianensis (strain ATCC 700841 / DSM 12885 / JCM 10246 / 7p75a) TaxID=644966 RepID=E6SMR2_THEM7|nr:PaaI family thioesterase [Thermaerobacter marianensis]ADU51554.1 thioesterase superfamily protein [Thermaerobacter marianensis DSM 12885]